jgi:hypothetical protein
LAVSRAGFFWRTKRFRGWIRILKFNFRSVPQSICVSKSASRFQHARRHLQTYTFSESQLRFISTLLSTSGDNFIKTPGTMECYVGCICCWFSPPILLIIQTWTNGNYVVFFLLFKQNQHFHKIRWPGCMARLHLFSFQ